MISGSRILWDVDTQVDFIDPAGKLYVPGAEKIIGNLQRLTRWALQQGVLVVASMDAHLPTDAEFADYPPHCLVGTPGQKKIAGTVLPRHYVVPNRKVELPTDLNSYQQVIVEKQATDVFTNPNLNDLLVRLGKDREVVVYGVVTEICVGHAARGLIARGYRVHLVGDAIRHLDAAKSQATIAAVEESGGRLLTTEEFVK